MSRFLFVVPPLAGHIHPAAAVAAELTGRGHEVAWVGDPVLLGSLLPSGADIRPSATPELAERPATARGFAALKFLWEQLLVPVAAAMTPAVEQAVDSFHPDVLVVDQQALAGALVAERRGLLWATSATTSSELTSPLAALPKVQEWLAALLVDLRAGFGEPSATGDLRFSPHLVLAYTTPELVGAEARVVDAPVQFVGPTRGSDVAADRQPERDPRGPLVFVSLGTVSAQAGHRFLAAAVDALRERPHLRGLVVSPDADWTDLPPHVDVKSHVPQLEALARASAVVCHGGHNTVCEALSYGLPLVVAPIRDDQSLVAEQVVNAGAGIRLRIDRSDAGQVGAAVDQVLADPSYAAAAGRLQGSFRAAGGARAAADSLERLLTTAVAPGLARMGD